MANVRALGSLEDITRTFDSGIQQLTTGLTRRGGIVPIAYPSTLDSNIHDSYLVFYAVKPVGNSAGLSVKGVNQRQLDSVKGKFSEEMISVIQLYVPNMVETLNHTYEANESGFLQDIMNAVQPSLAGAMNSIGNDDYGAAADHGMNAARGVGGVIASTGEQVLSKVALEANTQTTGQIWGDKNIVLFKGTSPRTQTFTFYLTPRNKAELVSIANIIKTFYVNSSATVTHDYDDISSIMYEVPPLWFVEERTKNSSGPRYTPKFQMGPAAITSIRMNKTPEQVYQTLAGTSGDAKTIEFEITLSELRPTTSEYWKEAFKNLGKYTADESSPFGSYK